MKQAADIIKRMAEQGMRITEQRRTLAKLFTEQSGYLSPKDVYNRMELEYPGLSFDTVYRNLRLLHEMGILEQFVREDGIKFRLHCDESHHHHHFICMECERTYPYVFCPMPLVEKAPDQFEVVQHKFEIYGYCKDCKE